MVVSAAATVALTVVPIAKMAAVAANAVAVFIRLILTSHGTL